MLSLPPTHPYVDAVAPPGAVRVRPERVQGWEPDPYLDPEVVAAWAGDVDVVHLHFGYDHLSPSDAAAWVRALELAHLPLVLTVHDLRNPHHPERHRHDEVLAVLVPAAAAVLTLTPGAASEIARRFGRRAVVVPHPTLVDPARTDDVATEAGLVALHLKSLRTNLVEPLAVLESVARGAAAGGGRTEVHVHPTALGDPRLSGLDTALAAAAARGASIELWVHERLDHLALERALRRAQVTVLPYRWGTHSGWLELARDLGTRVVAPGGGPGQHYGGQWDAVVTYPYDEVSGLDAAGLAAAVERSLRLPPLAPADRAARLAEAAGVRLAHAEVYERVRAAAATEVAGR